MAKQIQPTTFLKPSSITVSTLFDSNNFTVPDYQRDYSWSKDEVLQLWDDIILITQRSYDSSGTIVTNPRPHFLGPIVLESDLTDPEKNLEIMDGQQRLVTLSVLFSVLFEFADKLTIGNNKEVWTNTLNSLRFTWRSAEKIPKITLARHDQHFQELVINRQFKSERDDYLEIHLTDHDKKRKTMLFKIVENINTLHENISKYLGSSGTEGYDKNFEKLIESVLELTIVLKMEVLEKGAAYEVFETLNSRGLELQQADLLKNRLYFLADQQNTREEVSASWENIANYIEQQSFISLTEFFHFFMISSFKFSKLSDLYDTVCQHLDKPENNAKNFVKQAEDVSEKLQLIIEGTANNRDIESITKHLINKYALTLLIAGATKFSVTSADMAEVISLTHYYVFRRFVVERLGMSAYATEISSVARDFVNGSIPNVSALKDKLSSLSEQETFEKKFTEYSAPNNRIGFYIIEMIENHLTQDSGTIVQRQSVSQHLEHIMPKSPDPYKWPHVEVNSEYKENINKFGNLLVLEADINRYIKNNSFSDKNENEKNKGYKNSSMTLPKSVEEYLESGIWTFQSISNRQADIVSSFAKIVWPL